MNLKVKTQEIKKLVRELEISEQALKQSLAVITSRKNSLKLELDSLGASSSTRKGQFSGTLSEKQSLQLIGNLTK